MALGLSIAGIGSAPPAAQSHLTLGFDGEKAWASPPKGDILTRILLRGAGFSESDVNALVGGAAWGDITGVGGSGGATATGAAR